MFGEQVPERLGCSGGAAGAGGEGDGDPLAVRRGSLSGASVQRRLVDDGAGGRHAAVRREQPPPLLSGEMVHVMCGWCWKKVSAQNTGKVQIYPLLPLYSAAPPSGLNYTLHIELHIKRRGDSCSIMGISPYLRHFCLKALCVITCCRIQLHHQRAAIYYWLSSDVLSVEEYPLDFLQVLNAVK